MFDGILCYRSLNTAATKIESYTEGNIDRQKFFFIWPYRIPDIFKRLNPKKESPTRFLSIAKRVCSLGFESIPALFRNRNIYLAFILQIRNIMFDYLQN